MSETSISLQKGIPSRGVPEGGGGPWNIDRRAGGRGVESLLNLVVDLRHTPSHKPLDLRVRHLRDLDGPTKAYASVSMEAR